MLSINQFRMRLPEAYQHQSQDIISRVGNMLCEADINGLQNIDILDIPSVKVNKGAGIDEIASGIVSGIKSTLGGNE